MEFHLQPPRAAYIHIPFCAHRCGYCNFTLVAGRDDLIGPYLHALETELAGFKQTKPVDTLFLGGGTPSHLPQEALRRLLQIVTRQFPLATDSEFSVEANPIDLNQAKAALLAEYGVTRISLGAQSFDSAKLRRLERDHSAADIAAACRTARQFVSSVSFDLIFGTPDETLATWHDDLTQALELAPDHISTYGLTYEKGTSFWTQLSKNELRQLPEETERQMYEMAIERLAAAEFEHYEVSNFAQPGHRCRHNETYWLGGSYYAAGPGAARYVDGRRETNHRSTTTYLRRIASGKSPVEERETLSSEDRAREMLVFGLRLLAGVDRTEFHWRTGHTIESLVGEPLADHVRGGRFFDDGKTIRLTREGLLVSDAIWPDFLRT